jgi:hypothetical protein
MECFAFGVGDALGWMVIGAAIGIVVAVLLPPRFLDRWTASDPGSVLLDDEYRRGADREKLDDRGG